MLIAFLILTGVIAAALIFLMRSNNRVLKVLYKSIT